MEGGTLCQGAAAAPGVLLAAASWVWVQDPLPKNCRGGSLKGFPSLIPMGGHQGSHHAWHCLSPSPPQGLHRGTSLTDPFPQTWHPRDQGAGCWGAKPRFSCGTGRGWLLRPLQPPTLPPGQGTKGEAGGRSVGTGTRQHPPGTQRAPWGTPRLLATGKGLLFPRETEARVGWAGGKMARPRSPKGTRTEIQASGVPCPALPAVAGAQGAHTRLGALVHTRCCEHTRTLSCAPLCTHTCAPPALCSATTCSDKPRTCHLCGHGP